MLLEQCLLGAGTKALNSLKGTPLVLQVLWISHNQRLHLPSRQSLTPSQPSSQFQQGLFSKVRTQRTKDSGLAVSTINVVVYPRQHYRQRNMSRRVSIRTSCDLPSP